MAIISKTDYDALSDGERQAVWETGWHSVPRIGFEEREAGDLVFPWWEAFKLVGEVPQMFRMTAEGWGGQASVRSVVIRGMEQAEVYRLLRRWEGIVYARDRA